MAKSEPIGVRFDLKVREILKGMGIITSQKALNFLENHFMKFHCGIERAIGKKAESQKATIKIKTRLIAKVQEEKKFPKDWNTMGKTDRLKWLRENRK